MTRTRKIFGANERARLCDAARHWNDDRSLAEAAGMKVAAMRAIMSGEKEPTANQLGALYQLLGLSFTPVGSEDQDSEALWVRRQLLQLNGSVASMAVQLAEKNEVRARVDQIAETVENLRRRFFEAAIEAIKSGDIK